jgi:hypothetical protein
MRVDLLKVDLEDVDLREGNAVRILVDGLKVKLCVVNFPGFWKLPGGVEVTEAGINEVAIIYLGPQFSDVFRTEEGANIHGGDVFGAGVAGAEFGSKIIATPRAGATFGREHWGSQFNVADTRLGVLGIYDTDDTRGRSIRDS